MPRSICGIAAAFAQNLHLIGAVNTEFKVEHRILPGIPILSSGTKKLGVGLNNFCVERPCKGGVEE